MAVDINRTTSISLPGDVSSEILKKTQEGSAVMTLAHPIKLPGLGTTIPVITGDPEAAWVNETDKKPVNRGTLSTKPMSPYTLAVIVPFSNQFRRDVPALMHEHGAEKRTKYPHRAPPLSFRRQTKRTARRRDIPTDSIPRPDTRQAHCL